MTFTPYAVDLALNRLSSGFCQDLILHYSSSWLMNFKQMSDLPSSKLSYSHSFASSVPFSWNTQCPYMSFQTLFIYGPVSKAASSKKSFLIFPIRRKLSF